MRDEIMHEAKMALQKLWNRDFSLLVFGQTISIFGNMILSFALPLRAEALKKKPSNINKNKTIKNKCL